ncbi:MAG: hypothetical protein ACKOW5_03655 [Actinomycetales bacterium]
MSSDSALMASAITNRIPTSVGVLAIADHGTGIPVVLWPSLFADHRFYGLASLGFSSGGHSTS